MGKRHRIEQYYSIRVDTENGSIIVLDTANWDGSVEHLAQKINDATHKQWKKVRILKYTQNIDMMKGYGSRIVGQKRSLLKVDRIGSGSLCTKVDENFMRNGVIPHNILAFFGEQNGR